MPVKPIPEGYHTVTPLLSVKGAARLIYFFKKAFGATYYVYVQDADATYRAALSAGGESLEAPTDQFWGDRVATIKDFAGNKWMIATHVEDVSADELERRARNFMTA